MKGLALTVGRRLKAYALFVTKSPEIWVGLLVAGVISLGVFLSTAYWDWLLGGTDHTGHSAAVRNVALVIGGVVALIVALWRSVVAERQHRLAQLGLLNERYQKGADMLGSEVRSVRIGGIYALRALAEERPQQYGVQILRVLCTFVRNPVLRQAMEEGPADVQAAMDAILGYDKSKIVWDEDLLDLREAGLLSVNLLEKDLAGANLTRADLSWAELKGANLKGAILVDAELVGADLRLTNLKGANLRGAKLAKAKLTGADMTDADLSGADLTDTTVAQAQLDSAYGNEHTRLPEGLAISIGNER